MRRRETEPEERCSAWENMCWQPLFPYKIGQSSLCHLPEAFAHRFLWLKVFYFLFSFVKIKARCPSFISVAVIKISWYKATWGGVILALNPRFTVPQQLILLGMSQCQEPRQLGTSHPKVRAERMSTCMFTARLAFSTFTQSRAPTQGMARPTFRLRLPTSMKSLKTIPCSSGSQFS